MKAISLHQPWASLIAMKLKTYETRSWSTKYRGELLICSAKRKYKNYSSEETTALKACELAGLGKFDDEVLKFIGNKQPLGCAIAIVQLTDCIQMTDEFIKQQSELEIVCGDWSISRYAWKLENIKPVGNIPIKGAQGLFNVDYPLIKV